jgi:uncharacterized protein (TIGR02145 family)
MKKLTFVIVLLALMIDASGQNPYLKLIFTAVDNGYHAQLDSIKIINQTQECDTVLYWPDTLLLLGSDFGISDYNQSGKNFKVFQNYPNPVLNQTTIPVYVPEKGEVKIMITDLQGRMIAKTERELEIGLHSYSYMPGTTGISFFTTQWKDVTSSIRILSSVSQMTGANPLEYIGGEPYEHYPKVAVAIQNFNFSFGDTLLYIGYTNTLESGILSTPEAHETYTFQFATNIPCPGTPTVEYEGQVYNTIQIFSQCWLKENLNVGSMIPGGNLMGNNGIIEKHCYHNKPDSCAKYGALYQWNEMMQYTTQQGSQGICPPDWHVPTDEEWKVLEGAVDSMYGIGHQIWNIEGLRGFDAGANLKTTNGWYSEGNGADLFDFSGLPGGARYGGGHQGYFDDIVYNGSWWTSTEYNLNYARFRLLKFDSPEVYNYYGSGSKDLGFSVRCVRD